jgi:alcohol dehydrogenase
VGAIPSFEVGPLPCIAFGEGVRSRLPDLAAGFGNRVLLVTGARSLERSDKGRELCESFAKRGLDVQRLTVAGEPSPEVVDAAVREYSPHAIDVVVAIGGGSALDAAKAVAGLLPSGRPVMDHLEVVGRGIPYEGPATPLLAAPTTAGTGSEATRNAVLSRGGPAAFKRSFRHEALVPRWAAVDPDLLETCPRPLIAADGLDALTQLLESYVSLRASAFTDALAGHGLAAVRDGLLAWYEGTGDPRAARSRMAYAALLSGITLAHAGLGVVHGLSAPLGALFEIPHGVACGTLLPATTAANVAALRARESRSPALSKYGRAWAILVNAPDTPAPDDAPERLADLLGGWIERLGIARLAHYGVKDDDLQRIVDGGRAGSTKTNPIALEDREAIGILRSRL